jgi:hypothetical protein
MNISQREKLNLKDGVVYGRHIRRTEYYLLNEMWWCTVFDGCLVPNLHNNAYTVI